jgi:hypothetical protein
MWFDRIAKPSGALPEPDMGGALQRCVSLGALGRGLVLATSLGTGGCGAVMNAIPDPSSARLPDKSTFFPTGITSYTRPISAEGPVAAADLVDGQGRCAGAPSGGAALAGVSLEMTECEVVRTLGPPQSTEIGTRPPGERSAVLTYMSGDHAGIYRFASGRLITIDRAGESSPPPPVAKKPSAKRVKPAQSAGQ